MNARGVREDELRAFEVFDPEDTGSGRLRLVRHDGDLLIEDPIEKGRFSYIGFAEYGHKTRFEGAHGGELFSGGD
jgi:hypothetical protein